MRPRQSVYTSDRDLSNLEFERANSSGLCRAFAIVFPILALIAMSGVLRVITG
jgi:hypothetical protein